MLTFGNISSACANCNVLMSS